uniref:Uncharacterized protein n=1 Tax=Cacopsylla melanoneura TaxID=428564 RepID=A0A8D8WRX3_9HEMI
MVSYNCNVSTIYTFNDLSPNNSNFTSSSSRRTTNCNVHVFKCLYLVFIQKSNPTHNIFRLDYCCHVTVKCLYTFHVFDFCTITNRCRVKTSFLGVLFFCTFPFNRKGGISFIFNFRMVTTITTAYNVFHCCNVTFNSVNSSLFHFLDVCTITLNISVDRFFFTDVLCFCTHIFNCTARTRFFSGFYLCNCTVNCKISISFSSALYIGTCAWSCIIRSKFEFPQMVGYIDVFRTFSLTAGHCFSKLIGYRVGGGCSFCLYFCADFTSYSMQVFAVNISVDRIFFTVALYFCTHIFNCRARTRFISFSSAL